MKRRAFVVLALLLCLLWSAARAEAGVTIDRAKLIQAAIDYQSHSYAPYSHYNVAAAVLMSNGKTYLGVNVENAAYPAGLCAEDNAITTAIADDKNAYIVAIAIVGGPNYTVRDYCPPCGLSRQVIREFYKPDVTRVIVAKSKDDYKEMSLDELLPQSFGPNNLGK